MTVDESLAVLRANLGYSPEEREHAYAVAREGILLEISTAPTPALKARYQRKLSELEAANAAAKTVSGANLPKKVSGSTNPSPEPTAAAPAVIPATLPPPPLQVPTNDPHPKQGHHVEPILRKRLIMVGVGAAALLAIVALVILTGNNRAKPQVNNVQATGVPSGRDDIGSVDSQPKTLAVTTMNGNAGGSVNRPPVPEPTSSGPQRSALEAMEAVKPILEAAKKGDVQAQNEIGLFYLSGKHGGADSTAGVAWLTRAAQGGSADAQNSLASIYERGAEVKQSFENAGQLYALAANQGHGPATLALARMTIEGVGTNANPVKAWALATLAQERGEKEAEKMITEIWSNLDSKQKAAAEKELGEMKTWKNR